MRCEEIERLLYLKKDELSEEERSSLYNHLQGCESCKQEYGSVSQFLERAQFTSPSMDSRFIEARITDSFKKYQDNKLYKNSFAIRRNILKALSIASVFFLIIFSVEQVNTVRKISQLEQKLADTGSTAVQPQKQILVLNHFYDMDDLKQILNPDNLSQAGMVSFLPPGSSDLLNINLFNKGGKILTPEIWQSSCMGKITLNGGFYGNPRLLNLITD